MAGLIGTASLTSNGLMPSGYAFTTFSRNLTAGESYVLGSVNGLFLFQDIRSYGHWHLMFKAKDTLYNLSGQNFGYVSLSVNDDGNLVLKNSGTSVFSVIVIYQNISAFG